MTPTFEIRLPNDTKELDKLLDERGQEHRVWPSGIVVWHDDSTIYEYEPAKNHHDEYWGGILRMTMRHLTPEQAIAATVGAGTCKRVYHPNRITKTCTCSNCGYGASDERWAYCPKCGHKYVHGEVEERWKKAGRKVAE